MFAYGKAAALYLRRPPTDVSTYVWEDTPTGGTRMTLRNRGQPAGFARIGAPVMSAAIRRANMKDLALKQILEHPST